MLKTEKGILNFLIMKKLTHFFLLLILGIATSGCFRLASSTTVDLSQFTAQPSDTGLSGAAVGATATPTLDVDTLNTLRIFPLWVGSTWVYDFLGYTLEEEAHWRLTETVVSSRMLDGYYVVAVERTAELTMGNPGPQFASLPPTGSFTYLIAGEDVYRFEGEVETDLDTAWLELVLPFPPEEEAWLPDPAGRSISEDIETGARFAQGPFDQVVSESGTRICYNVVTSLEEGTEEAIFCDGIGYLYYEADDGSGEGYRMEMIGYVLQ